jgi:hypothetical protein
MAELCVLSGKINQKLSRLPLYLLQIERPVICPLSVENTIKRDRMKMTEAHFRKHSQPDLGARRSYLSSLGKSVKLCLEPSRI